MKTYWDILKKLDEVAPMTKVQRTIMNGQRPREVFKPMVNMHTFGRRYRRRMARFEIEYRLQRLITYTDNNTLHRIIKSIEP